MFPNFLGIGAQKAATTWLCMVMKEHPQLWLTPTKEIHFFEDSDDEYSHFYRVLTKKEGYKRSLKRFRYTELKNVVWSYKYLFRKRDINYYKTLFTPGEGQLCGEICPYYARLTSDRIQRVKKYMPEVKLIYILRNPIERDWSATCMHFINNHNLDMSDVPRQKILDIALANNKTAHSNYAQNILNWESYFSKAQMFVGYYEEIQYAPHNFLKRLFSFLDVDELSFDDLKQYQGKKINSFSKIISPDILRLIAENEYENIQSIHHRLNNQYTAAWMKHANSILHK